MQLTAEMVKWRESGLSYRAIATKLGRPVTTVHDAFRAGVAGKGTPTPAAPARPAAAGATRTLADFRRDHDQSWKIRDGLKRLFAGGAIMTDAEFREAVNGNPSRWRAAADQAEFREFRYRVGGELLWAAKDTIREMRKIRGEAV